MRGHDESNNRRFGIGYGNASRIVDLLGKNGSCAAVRLSGFVLLCIATEVVLQGLRNTLSPALARPKNEAERVLTGWV